jgi:small subunit ribosomal protein S4
VITVRQNDKIYDLYKGVIANNSPSPPDWITFDGDTLRATMQRNPGPGDYSLPVNVDIVVEFLAR